MRRLYLQVYLTFLGILLLFGLLVSLTVSLTSARPQDQRTLDGVGVLLGELLPDPDQPADQLQAALERLGRLFPAHLTVRGTNGTLLASVEEPLPSPSADKVDSHWMRVGKRGPTFAFLLPDGRWVIVHWPHRHPPFGWLVGLGLLALAIAIGAYPVVRRLTRRLERLQTRVDALGAGDLTTRVEVEGKDEVANLARSFNHAADRIERLVSAQRTMFSGASHELRSPLARIRMAVELLPSEERPELQTQLAQDITELDELIGEILLASRLDTLDTIEHPQEVDLLALLAEEAARTQAEVGGEPVCIHGDPHMLRRLMRNLLENAQRYAAGSPIEAAVAAFNQGARLRVADRGPGIPEQERERIFEPFYRLPGMRESEDGGVGLGLALVRQIARRHGGDVRCVPREGGGTCFEVEFRTD